MNRDRMGGRRIWATVPFDFHVTWGELGESWGEIVIRPPGWLGKMRSDSFEGRLGVSTLVHLLAIASFSIGWWIWAKPMPAAGTTHGSRVMLMYMPGRWTSPTEQAKDAGSLAKTPRRPVGLRAMRASSAALNTTSRVALPADGTAGNDARGAGAASILRIQSFPKQMPDMSQYPSGTYGDIVVDIQIDSQGRVVNARTKKGMGHAIDEMVVATVEQWIFHPATKDGRPAMSEQELHFHYDHGNDSTCGWECFALVEQ